MAIEFACACGRKLKIGDEHAGKKVRCPSCGTAQEVPTPLEVAAEEEEDFDVEVIEDDPQASKTKPSKNTTTRPRAEDVEEDEPRPARKNRRRRREKGGPMSEMYMNQARKEMERDEMRVRQYGRDDEDEGWTIGGVHITAGVLTGSGLLFTGLLCMALIGIFRSSENVIVGPRVFIGAIVCTTIGLLTLAKAIFLGEED